MKFSPLGKKKYAFCGFQIYFNTTVSYIMFILKSLHKSCAETPTLKCVWGYETDFLYKFLNSLCSIIFCCNTQQQMNS